MGASIAIANGLVQPLALTWTASLERGASPLNDAACPQVNTPGVPGRTQEETRASQSGTVQGTHERGPTESQGCVGGQAQDRRHFRRLSLSAALEGATDAPASPPPMPLQSRCLVIEASGGEFRLVFHNNMGETRCSGTPCLTIVFGQKKNSRSMIGLGNPCEASVLSVTTSDKKMLFARGAPDEVKTWWVLIDPETGWVHAGSGERPKIKNALLGTKLDDLRHVQWSHVSISNWRERVDLFFSFAPDDSLAEPGEPWSGGHPLQKHLVKFDQFGRMKRSEGLTTVIHHGPGYRGEQKLHQVMCLLQGLLRTNSLLAPHFAFLPPASFHITCLGLLFYPEEFVQANGYDRSAGFGREPAINESLVACSTAVNECWDLVPHTLTFAPDLTRYHNNSVKLVVREEDALARWREEVAGRIHAKHMVSSCPGYIHHSTFAYQLYPITSREAAAAYKEYNGAALWMLASVGPMTLPKPDLCTFRDMGEFVPVPAGSRPALDPWWEDEEGQTESQRGAQATRADGGEVPDAWEDLPGGPL
jgi:hypothetical protein